MTNTGTSRQAWAAAFTLIELLVVIAIIAILAALIFPAAGAIKKRATINKAQTELQQVTTAVELYKEKQGFYPPDNPGMPELNQLYYELVGTELKGNTPTYETLDGSAQIAVGGLTAAFGSDVGGLVNSTKGTGADEAGAKSFLKALKPGQYVSGTTNGVAVRLLTCSVQWPMNRPSVIPGFMPSEAGVNPNPWRYNSSSPTNNPGSYDLWVDVLIANKTYRISNWSKQPQVVPTP